jgi:hypothetical protein
VALPLLREIDFVKDFIQGEINRYVNILDKEI